MNNREINAKKTVDGLEKALGNGQPVSFKIENSDGKEIEVSREEFAKFVEGNRNHFQSPKVPKETLTYIIKADINGKTYSVERTGKDEFYKESYYQPRPEEEKKRLLEQGARRKEVSQKGNSESQCVENDINLNKLSQEVNQTQCNNDNKSKYIIGSGLIGLLLLLGIIVKLK